MKKILSFVTLCSLAACGGSGGGGVAPTTFTTGPAPLPTPVSSSSPGAGPSSGPVSTIPTSVNNNSFAGLLNNVRIANSAAPVTFDARLGSAAQKHANDMLANNYFSHTGLNGSSPGDRIEAEGYNWRTYGENIARGQTSETQVLNAWVNSPGHQANNVNPNFEDFGLGKAGTGSSTRWVLVLGAEQ